MSGFVILRLGRRWNIDPVDKPFESAYATFGGNPVLFVDPNGDDWFYNEGTGDVSYKSDEGKGHEKDMGEGWQWLGANDMFSDEETGNETSDVLEENKDLMNSGTYFTINKTDENGESYVATKAFFEGDKAKEFMKKQDFDFKPTSTRRRM